MNKHIKKEIFVALGMLLITGACLVYEMKPLMYVISHALLVFLFIVFAIIIWNEKITDERSLQHRIQSSNIGFTVGGIILGITMVLQILNKGFIDIWVIITISSMIVARVISQIWLDKHH